MDQTRISYRALFASGMIGMAIVGFRFGDFASVAQEFPKWIPARTAIIYVAAAVMLLGGIGLIFERTAALSARVLFGYLAVWMLQLNVPIVIKHPLVEGSWQAIGEIWVLAAGGWVLFAGLDAPRDRSQMGLLSGARGIRFGQILFGLALIPLGLAHFTYLNMTAPLVPAWLPFHTAWAYITGAAQMAAGVGVLFSIRPRLAATLDAVLFSAFTFLVWPQLIIAKPSDQRMWSEFTTSWAITAAAFVVAASFESGARKDR